MGIYRTGAGVITTYRILDATILTGDIAAGAIQSGNIASGNIEWAHLKAGAVLSGQIASGQVEWAHMKAGAVVSGCIASGQVTGAHLAAGAVVSGNIASGQVEWSHVKAGAILSGQIASGQVHGFHMAAGAVVSGNISSGQIGTEHVMAGAILSGQIGAAIIATEHIAAAANIARSQLVENAVQNFGVPLQTLKNNDGTTLAAAAAAGVFGIISGGYGTGTLTLNGEAASNNAKTSTAMFEFVLPPEYVSAGDVNLVITARESVGAATVSTTYSCEAYESDKQGGVGANLAGSPDVTDITTSWQTSTTAVTASGLVAGDRLVVFIRLVSNDTGGAIGTIHQIGAVYMTVDIKG